ncbi:cation:proton antiporter [Rossellomorea vietnamensis]|uniref:Cation:proton antiporter n=1 Tax=Rossellomorea vietnamensis TaxID=218284 RepID=A0A5D4KAN2_9BACI|nr:cation:proton antiporter [Rossellomorea vietnamensis]TYR74358.1 cation:proton antiporter [Rossellomorea vietnamensis]
MFNIPIQDPVIIFAIAVTVFFLSPILMNKLRMPGIIGPIVAGVIIGPHGLHLLARDSTIELLGTVGLLFIIFIAGLELDLDGFKKYRNRSILFGVLSFSIPLVIGTTACLFLGYSLMASILLGSIVGSHTLLAYPIASRLGISKNKAVTTAVGGTLLTDTFALLVLAVITGAAAGELSAGFWMKMVISLSIFVFVIMWGVPLLSRWFFKNAGSEGIANFSYVMVILFGSAFLALAADMQPIIGAFLAGLALNRFVLEHGTLMNRIRFLGNALFIPFFLLSVGMLMDLGVLLSNPSAWLVSLCIILSVFVGKWLAPLIISRIYHYSKIETKVIFGLTIPQAAATLASTLVGYQVGLLDQATVNAVIIMILITCIAGPYFVEKHGRLLALKEDQSPGERSEGPERILIPLYNPDTMESLMDLAYMIKQPNTQEEPLYPLTVVQKDVKSAHKDVEKAEKMLGHAVMYASGAEMPVRMLTRVDRNISYGIERAIAEERINTVVVGWNAERKNNQLFGSVLDRLIDETHQTLLVSKLGHPLKTTKRVLLIIPYGADHKTGFEDALKRIKLLTSNLSASLLTLVIKDSIDAYEQKLNSIKPDPPASIRRVENWSKLEEEEVPKLTQDDLVIILSARRGTVGWHPKLEELPKRLAAIEPESFIIYYPSEQGHVDIRGSRGFAIPKEVLRKQDYDQE